MAKSVREEIKIQCFCWIRGNKHSNIPTPHPNKNMEPNKQMASLCKTLASYDEYRRSCGTVAELTLQ